MGFADGDKEVMDARNSLVPSMDLDPVEHLWNLHSLQTVQGMNDAPVETTRTIESKHHVRGVTQANGGQGLIEVFLSILSSK